MLLDTACKVWFGTWVLVLVLNVRALLGLIHSLPFLSKRQAEDWSHVVCGYMFRLSIGVCPWIRIKWEPIHNNNSNTKKGLSGERLSQVLDKDTTQKPVLMLMNHCSFIDSLIASAVLAQAGRGQFRFLMTESLFHIPVWGTMCRYLGHFPVFAFANKAGTLADPLGTTEGKHEDFRVDKEKMQRVGREIDAFVQSGGGLLIYPEGTISRQVRKGLRVTELLPFRYGGFAIGIRNKMRAVALVAQGCERVWPWKAGIGGLPGTIHLVAKPIPECLEAPSHVEASQRAKTSMEEEAVALFAEYSTDETGPYDPFIKAFHAVSGILLFAIWAAMLLPLLCAGTCGLLVTCAAHLLVLLLLLLGCGSSKKKNKDKLE